MRQAARHLLIAVVLAAAWGGGLGILHMRGPVPLIDGAEATLANFRTVLRGPLKAPDIVTIVAIDDAAARRAGSYPLPRIELARIVSAIAELEPRAIGLDVLLVDAGPQAGDAALAAALRQARTVIAAAAVFPESRQRLGGGQGVLAELPEAQDLLLPQRIFSDAAGLGIVNVETDKAGTPRFVPLLFRSGARTEASFPLSVAAAALGADPVIAPGAVAIGGRRVATDIGRLMPLSFYGPRGTIATISAADALDGRLPQDRIKDHVVVIGATVTGGGDVFPTPFDPVLPGVEVVSTAIDHLMAGDGLVRDRRVRLADAGTALLLPPFLVALVAWRRSGLAIAAILAVLALWAAANAFAFAHGIWFAAALPLAAVLPPLAAFGAAQLLLGRRRASHFESQSERLQRIQAPGLAAFLADDPAFLAVPVRQDAAVLFVDLNGFTGLSEQVGPAAVRDLLSSFYDIVDEEVSASGGAIASFMGDGAMVLFGLPAPKSEDAASAVRCALRLARRLRAWLAVLPPPASRLGFKIGCHFGAIVASRLGAGDRQQITAAGDTVNVASRLMEVAAQHGAAAAISDDLLHAAGPGNEASSAGRLEGPLETSLRGRKGRLAVWLWRP